MAKAAFLAPLLLLHVADAAQAVPIAGAGAGLMRKEVPPPAEAAGHVPTAAELIAFEQERRRQRQSPSGYYNRGQDCIGGELKCNGTADSNEEGVSSDDCTRFVSNIEVPNCADNCTKMADCVGFTYRADYRTCYFKRQACNSTTYNGWVFYQKVLCDYSEAACRTAARAANLSLGGMGWAFAGTYSTTGCYTYSSGIYKGLAFYGWYQGADVRIKEQLNGLRDDKVRPPGYGCEGGGLLEEEEMEAGEAEQPASMLELGESSQGQDEVADPSIRLEIQREPDLILEDELERAAAMPAGAADPEEEEVEGQAAAHVPRPAAPATPGGLEEVGAEDDGLQVVTSEDDEDLRLYGKPKASRP